MMNERKPLCVFDACTIINMIHLDMMEKENFLLNKLGEHFEYKISDIVFSEVERNKERRITKGKNRKREKDDIESRISVLRSGSIINLQLEKDCGDKFIEDIEKKSNYQKRNGEFSSVCLSLCLSRCNFERLTFYTDDYPAKKHFSPFFENQQIGYIADSVDLLVFLYWKDPDIKEENLEKMLSELYSFFSIKVSVFEKKVQEFRLSINSSQNKNAIRPLNELEKKLRKKQLSGINQLKNQIKQNLSTKKLRNTFNKLTDDYHEVFSLENSSDRGMLKKISDARCHLDEEFIYKI